MDYTEYEEAKAPEELLQKLQDSIDPVTSRPSMTFGQAGLAEWLTKRSKEGWDVVWEYGVGQFPYFLFTRKVSD